MGYRFHKRIKITKGLSINIGKKGISTSLKVGNTTFNSKGRVTTSIPGTGISYTTNLKKKRATVKRKATSPSTWVTKVENATQKLESNTRRLEKATEAMNHRVGNKNNYYVSKFTWGLSFVLMGLSLLLFSIGPLLGGGFLLFSFVIYYQSKKNMEIYQELWVREQQRQKQNLF